MTIHTRSFSDYPAAAEPETVAWSDSEAYGAPSLWAGRACDDAKQPGSRMPLDTDIHWDWRNPLNVIPALILLLVLFAMIGLMWV